MRIHMDCGFKQDSPLIRLVRQPPQSPHRFLALQTAMYSTRQGQAEKGIERTDIRMDREERIMRDEVQ